MNDKLVSEAMATTGLRTAIKILVKWNASIEQTITILRISRSTFFKLKKGNEQTIISLDPDQLERISFILNIHAALRIVFNNPENIYGFMKMVNNNPFFEGKTPLEVIAQGDFISLYETFKRIDTLRIPT